MSHFFNFHYLAKNEMVSSFCQVFMQTMDHHGYQFSHRGQIDS